MERLAEAVQHLLACPVCRGGLSLEREDGEIRCRSCRRAYPMQDGIPVLLGGPFSLQENELSFRDAVAAIHAEDDPQTLLRVAGRHHCVPLMGKLASEFHAGFRQNDWILDIGVGFGWHWNRLGNGAKVLGLDLSLSNLRLARRLLGHEAPHVVLVCGDAAVLPIRDRMIAGVWSVQAFQHFPLAALESVQSELDRVLRGEFRIRTHDLNPALVHRIVYGLLGKRFHRQGKADRVELNRLSACEWTERWNGFRAGRCKVTTGYSELFFHPDLRFSPDPYPLPLEQAILKRVPRAAGLLARQVEVRIEGSLAPASAAA